MNIRKMTADDMEAIVPLASQLGYKSTCEELNSRFSSLQNQEDLALFVGEVQGSIIAFMQIQETSTLMTGKRAELNAIVVDEQMRGKGFGKLMMTAAEDWVRSRGLPKLRLGSRTTRTDTHSFYKKYGFSIEKTWFIFSKSIN